MIPVYEEVTTRFLHQNERLIQSQEQEMPLVIEANQFSSSDFLQHFLAQHSLSLLHQVATYGAVLLRGFDITSTLDFEQALLSIQGFKGISDVFMAEEGRVSVDGLKYVLHTNAIYKTGGTAYLGGFHSENYYAPDVPSYISFCCLQPSECGGETGLIHMEKVYHHLKHDLQQRLEQQSFCAATWLVEEAAARYGVACDVIETACQQFNLPIVGNGRHRLIVMHKPNVFLHPVTQKKALQINFFELNALNKALRTYFKNDYQGAAWLLYRLIWRLPTWFFTVLEKSYLFIGAFCYAPHQAIKTLYWRCRRWYAHRLTSFSKQRVGHCFSSEDVNDLAHQMRRYYCSCLWQKGDILLVDNRQVVHAGMPGKGERVVRALIGNPLNISYQAGDSGLCDCVDKSAETLGAVVARSVKK